MRSRAFLDFPDGAADSRLSDAEGPADLDVGQGGQLPRQIDSRHFFFPTVPAQLRERHTPFPGDGSLDFSYSGILRRAGPPPDPFPEGSRGQEAFRVAQEPPVPQIRLPLDVVERRGNSAALLDEPAIGRQRRRAFASEPIQSQFTSIHAGAGSFPAVALKVV